MSDESWPSFLDCLESDPDRAWSEFFVYARTLLDECHLRILNRIDSYQQEDAIQDFICYCGSSGFRKLRQYKNTGRPFRAWLITAAHNFFVSWLRKYTSISDWEIPHQDHDEELMSWLDRIPGREPGPEAEALVGDLKRKLHDCIRRLRLECQALMHALLTLDFDTEAVARLLRQTRDGAFYKRLRGCEQELRVEVNKVGLEIYLPSHLAPEAEKGIA